MQRLSPRQFLHPQTSRSTKTSQTSLVPEQITDLNEELTPVIDKSVPRAKTSTRIRQQVRCEVLQVAVIANVERRTWMQQVSQKKIGIELFLRFQGAQVGVGKLPVVL